ncbi:signal peptide peptidase SppA [Alloprevotella sp. oral taxon 473]|uniref:signal peptide peptidase SppA n=1 Tax=Alloprevotella sp. oral taxon 473 TaxID=712469 RepID=UPI0002A383D9|nr:signal peptide peptidase SppA [Alloprevotella sp. oral taxon 473]EKX89088.1 signal peptide peptidase SppA [Alloprevotella sp. oral taxon 473 str. F0040]
MKQFLQYVLASIVGFVIVSIFTFIMFFVMLGALMASSGEQPKVDDNSVLKISLSGTLVDQAPAENPITALLGNNGATTTQGLDQLIDAIKVAKENDQVKGIYLEGGALQSDFASNEELRRALLDFKKSKKWIIAYADSYSQGTYYIASVADRVLLNPSGMLDWHGIAQQTTFYTGLMEKLGIKAQVFKVGTFKSAVEPFTLKQMSEANRLQMSELIGGLWKDMCTTVGASRQLSPDSLNSYADRYLALTDAKDYKQLKLVDDLVYIDQVRALLQQRAGGEMKLVTPNTLSALMQQEGDDQIAVYYASGNIVDLAGTGVLMGGDNEIVGEKVVSDLDKLAKDKHVKAVVLRINSGGGSAYASEQMWRAVQLLKQKKPVVVSMGGVAASGGYYMACGAQRIFADPTTITGSIGIFAMIPEASELLTQKLGLNFDVVKTNRASDFGGRALRIDELGGAALQKHVNHGYALFLKRVADGRSAAGRRMSINEVDNIGQGRVWTGRKALQIGLVDQLGSLNEAITYAAKLAKTQDYYISNYPNNPSWLDNLKSSTDTDSYMERKLRTALGEYYEPLQMLHQVGQHNYMQARLPFSINFK